MSSGAEDDAPSHKGGGGGVSSKVAAQAGPSFKPSLIKALLKHHWEQQATDEEKATKISADAVKMVAEYLRMFIVESYKRASFEARLNGDDILSPEHLEKAMAGIFLDF
ncbi:hypothetical protein JKP88DRAFT_267615, partial [Tribonema minus]